MLFGKPRAQGYACITGLDGRVWKEADTYTCIRCNAVIHVPLDAKFEQVADIDPRTLKVMCARHAGEDDRRTFIQRVEPEEERDERIRTFRRLSL